MNGKYDADARDMNNVVAGRNPVIALLNDTNKEVECVYIESAEAQGSIKRIIALAKARSLPIKEVNKQKLFHLCGSDAHQGVVAISSDIKYSSVDDILEAAGDEHPFIIVAEEIQDPHNLGAIMRTAYAAGAHGIIIPKRRTSGLSTTVIKSSAGAALSLPVARVTNVASTIEELKQKNLWVYSADMYGEPWCTVDYSGGVVLVVGNEGEGVSRLIKDKSDFKISLPMKEGMDSLNASVAAGIIMYEIKRQRMRQQRL